MARVTNTTKRKSSIVRVTPATPKPAKAPPRLAAIPPPAASKRTTKAAIEVTGRYLICPMTTVIHEIRFVPVKETNGKRWFVCPCGCECQLPGTTTAETGYSYRESVDIANKCNGFVCGY